MQAFVRTIASSLFTAGLGAVIANVLFGKATDWQGIAILFGCVGAIVGAIAGAASSSNASSSEKPLV